MKNETLGMSVNNWKATDEELMAGLRRFAELGRELAEVLDRLKEEKGEAEGE